MSKLVVSRRCESILDCSAVLQVSKSKSGLLELRADTVCGVEPGLSVRASSLSEQGRSRCQPVCRVRRSVEPDER